MPVVKCARNWEELIRKVEENDGVATVEMGVIRDLAGYAKLGKHVLADASSQMGARGLGHYPLDAENLPLYQHERIRVFKKGSHVDRLYQAMARVSTEDEQAQKDDELIAEIANSEANEKLKAIRKIACT
jgi:hypothetical protein